MGDLFVRRWRMRNIARDHADLDAKVISEL